MEKRLLITGFDAFGGSEENPSWLAVSQLPDTVGGFTLKKCMIPTVFGRAAQEVLAAAEDFQPDVILCVGVAAGRDAVTPERIAVNIRDARIPDNAGNQPVGEFVVADAPAAYFSTVPVAAMAQAIRDAGVPGTVSNSAGAFVCNDTLYLLLHHFAGTSTRVGFIHVPAAPHQHAVSLPLEKTIQALISAISAC
ncbi:MAG: pyroglutamyl-peptidase I [Oscillospiraceae bacterium]|nr:pyroglutamyl-peptidase I [Oscillospiraceae bacterium]